MATARHRHPNSLSHHIGSDLDSQAVLSGSILAGHANIFSGQSLHEYLVALAGMVTDAEVGRLGARAVQAVVKATVTPDPAWTFRRRTIPVESAEAAPEYDPPDTYYIHTDPFGGTYESASGNFNEDGYWLGDAYGIAYGNGLWVMVSEQGYVLTTDDIRKPASWTSNTRLVGETLNGIAYNGSLWVAVGDGIWTATDPRGDWTFRQAANFIYEIAYGGGLWMATPDSMSSYYTSPDGITWTSRTQPFGSNGYTISAKHGGGVWVMVGGSDSGAAHRAKIATSSDGISWTVRFTSATNVQSYHDVDYGDGTWVVAGYRTDSPIGTTVITSTNPASSSWTHRNLSLQPQFPNAIAYGNGTWVILPEAYVNQAVLRSTDPANGAWTLTSTNTDANEWVDGVYAGGVWAILGQTFGEGPRLAIADFITVAPTADAFIARAVTGDATIRAAVSGGFAANAVLLRAGAGALVADAVALRTQASSLTTDAVISVAGYSFTTDAVVHRTTSSSLTADAVIRAVITGSFTADAKLESGFSADAVIVALNDAFDPETFQSDAFQ